MYKIEEARQVSDALVSKWKTSDKNSGAETLLLQYKGPPSYLSPESHQEVIDLIKKQNYFSVEELRDYLEKNYQVTYKSKQSYYE